MLCEVGLERGAGDPKAAVSAACAGSQNGGALEHL
jgi:hypothetical protein